MESKRGWLGVVTINGTPRWAYITAGAGDSLHYAAFVDGAWAYVAPDWVSVSAGQPTGPLSSADTAEANEALEVRANRYLSKLRAEETSIRRQADAARAKDISDYIAASEVHSSVARKIDQAEAGRLLKDAIDLWLTQGS